MDYWIPLRRAGQTCHVEAFLQAGLALMLPAERKEAAGERRCLTPPFGERAQVASSVTAAS
jgi:hypothetical protein